MSERRMLEPAQTGRPRWRSPSVVARLRWVVPVCVVAVAAVLVGVLPASGAPAAAPVPGTAQAVPAPGIDPAVQRWFKNREGLQIELNNALLAAQKLPRPAAAARPVCTRLLKVATALSAYGRLPAAPLDTLVRTGLDSFVKAATTCLAGDLATAEQLVARGLAERAAVSEKIDETLDGD
jgi:hypothetical protein